ncbi:hypothetical protein V2I01_28220 [Micromonospora sp. BRA006-A]|nr:hypothetical protein [Micromonospora sp. BRA006-A]
MPASVTALLRRQFDLTWALAEYHLDRLEPADFSGSRPRCAGPCAGIRPAGGVPTGPTPSRTRCRCPRSGG